MISNKVIALNEQRNVAMSNLNIIINRFLNAEKSHCPETMEHAAKAIDEHQAVLQDISRLMDDHQQDRQVVTDLETALEKSKAKIKARECTIIELQTYNQQLQDSMAVLQAFRDEALEGDDIAFNQDSINYADDPKASAFIHVLKTNLAMKEQELQQERERCRQIISYHQGESDGYSCEENCNCVLCEYEDAMLMEVSRLVDDEFLPLLIKSDDPEALKRALLDAQQQVNVLRQALNTEKLTNNTLAVKAGTAGLTQDLLADERDKWKSYAKQWEEQAKKKDLEACQYENQLNLKIELSEETEAKMDALVMNLRKQVADQAAIINDFQAIFKNPISDEEMEILKQLNEAFNGNTVCAAVTA